MRGVCQHPLKNETCPSPTNLPTSLPNSPRLHPLLPRTHDDAARLHARGVRRRDRGQLQQDGRRRARRHLPGRRGAEPGTRFHPRTPGVAAAAAAARADRLSRPPRSLNGLLYFVFPSSSISISSRQSNFANTPSSNTLGKDALVCVPAFRLPPTTDIFRTCQPPGNK